MMSELALVANHTIQDAECVIYLSASMNLLANYCFCVVFVCFGLTFFCFDVDKFAYI